MALNDVLCAVVSWLCVYQVSDDYVIAVNIFADNMLTAACRNVSEMFVKYLCDYIARKTSVFTLLY